MVFISVVTRIECNGSATIRVRQVLGAKAGARIVRLCLVEEGRLCVFGVGRLLRVRVSSYTRPARRQGGRRRGVPLLRALVRGARGGARRRRRPCSQGGKPGSHPPPTHRPGACNKFAPTYRSTVPPSGDRGRRRLRLAFRGRDGRHDHTVL